MHAHSPRNTPIPGKELKAVLVGAVTGLVGTTAMTATMMGLEQKLPRHEREPLEPRRITESLLAGASTFHALPERQKADLSILAHLGYGAAMGALYQTIERRLPLPPLARGAAFGLMVWAASYAGWLPALGILPPPHRRPVGRNGLLIASHLMWGVVTAAASGGSSTTPSYRRNVIPRRGGSNEPGGIGGKGSSSTA